jgi:Zn-dependent M28 family amino/carboxypeptidase
MDKHLLLDETPDTGQMEIMARLSGKKAIEKGYFLSSRYSTEEKRKVRNYLKSLIEQLSLTAREQPYDVPPSRPGSNIYTVLPATVHTDEYVIIGAHFDTVAGTPGANDNASGIALVYTVVKKLKAQKRRNKNVIMVFFDDEEIGYKGSGHFAEKIAAEGLNVHSVHTIDQMGWDEDGDRAIELELPTKALQKRYTEMAARYNIPVHITDVYTTDHHSFRARGFKAVGLTEEYCNGDTTPHIHQPTDTYETINFAYLASTTELVFQVLNDILTE